MNIRQLRGSTIVRAIAILDKQDLIKIVLVTGVQILMSILDLIGVALIGILGALTVNGISSKKQGTTVTSALRILHLNDLPLHKQAAILGILAAILLVSRTLLSIIFTKRTLFFLSRKAAVISSNLLMKFLAQPLIKIQERTSQEILYSVTSGVAAITLGVIGILVNLIADSSLLLVMSVGLFLVDPVVALSTGFVFAFLGFMLYKLMHNKAEKLGLENARLSIESSEKIIEVLSSYRESIVRNRRYFYSEQIGFLRLQLADTLAEIAFMPNIGKYVIEGTVIIGSMLIAGIQFQLKDATHAIGTLTIFLAAGSRIAPAVLRIQQGAIGIKGNIGSAIPTLKLIEELSFQEGLESTKSLFCNNHVGFSGSMEIQNLTYTYPGKQQPSINGISFSVNAGEVVAIVGPSGAGKTTLVDSILGVLKPQIGNVMISGTSPDIAIKKWPGAISYVPQDVLVISGTLKENIVLGYSSSEVDESLIEKALEIASLRDFVAELPHGLNTLTGERGAKLSGGQRQRLGIARAVITSPSLLVLDEATSALDGGTELEISNSIKTLKGSTTVLLIAHRLSTVRDADLVIYMDRGNVIAQGKFDEVRIQVPDFDNQAKLMGL